MAERKQTDMPFRVVTVAEQNMHSGHENMEQAEFAMNEANKQAEILGIKGRYQVIPKP